MTANKSFVYNTLLLTGTSLLMSCIGIAFQVWLAERIGAAGIGLYQLVLSVSSLLATFAVSGVRFAATRLVAEELGSADAAGVRLAMNRCMRYGTFFGFSAGMILFLLAEPLGFLWIGDARTVRALRLSALCMPCISLCACISGYFTACGRVWKPSLVHLIEQLCGILLTCVFLRTAPRGDIEASCTAVTLGRVLSDILSLLLMLLAYAYDCSVYCKTAQASALTGRMLRIALPLAVSSYARSTLSTFQHILVPRGLKDAGFSADRALSGYGTIQGMVLPILFFPSCLLSAAAELIVPALTEAQMRRDTAAIRLTAEKLLRMSFRYALCVASILFVFSDQLGRIIYKSAEAGHYLRLLAPMIPILYTDMSLDGCLKGLGEQMWCMAVNITDALCGLLLIWYMLPRYALDAYIAILYLTELLNFTLSYTRLRNYLRPSSPL